MTPPSPEDLPRPEHPRPQFVRDAWLNLNGRWQFEVDRSDTGLERGLGERDPADVITVPFCQESELSGVGETDFLEAVWYRRTVTVPAGWAGSRVLLHFGAVDHDTAVWVNGTEVARHRGGFTPFTADLHGVAGPGDEAVIVVRARDTQHGPQARGKQATRFTGLVDVLLDDPEMFGYCYIPLTDVFQERNGVYAFDRTAKFDAAVLRRIQRCTAACESRT